MSFCITINNGNQLVYQDSITPFEIVKSFSNSLCRDTIVAKVNGTLWDLNNSINFDANVEFLTWNDAEAKTVFWHSSAHLLAGAVKALYPQVQLGTGPAIHEGFYYDVDLVEPNIKLDLRQVEAKILELAREKNKFIRKKILKKDAINFFEKQGNVYKIEILNKIQDLEVVFYTQGTFTDLCLGPHIANTEIVKAIRLTNIAGAYWQGDVAKNQMTRIYGISFPNIKALEDYENNKKEAENRNHKKIGKELKLFMFSERVGLGLPIWLPKGAIMRHKLIDLLYKDQLKSGYLPVVTPHIGNKNLYVTSGHYEKYKDDSFKPIKTPDDNEEYFLKPMNCPHHCEIYRNEIRSYKDLPLRFCEFGNVYRYEQHGELNGLVRARSLTQDDAHIFCTKDQLKTEFSTVIDKIISILRLFEFDKYLVRVSLRDKKKLDKYIGDPLDWQDAEDSIRQILLDKNLENIETEGEAAFYGPKLDFIVNDSLGRKWQLGTIQLDYQLPKRFELEYIGVDGNKYTPCMIHRAPLGSIERFIALLLEHTSGRLPFWLTPEQVIILTVSDKFDEYAIRVKEDLSKTGIIISTDLRREKLGRKILDAELKKIPYIVTIGQKEVENSVVAVREYGSKEILVMSVNDFCASILKKSLCEF